MFNSPRFIEYSEMNNFSAYQIFKIFKIIINLEILAISNFITIKNSQTYKIYLWF